MGPSSNGSMNNPASGGILRSMRESLLRELRRDLNKLTNRTSDNGAAATKGGKEDPAGAVASAAASSSAAATENPKFVNVRPGLALGVITLQAGSRGPKISLH